MKVSYWTFGSMGLSAYQGSIPNEGSMIVRLYWSCASSACRVCSPSPKVLPSPASTGSTNRKLCATPAAGLVGLQDPQRLGAVAVVGRDDVVGLDAVGVGAQVVNLESGGAT